MIDLKAITPLALDPSFEQDGVFIPFSEAIVVMQSTGLTDKNGKEIYEGDILLEEWFGHRGRNYKHEVRWADFGWGLSKNGRKDSVTYFTPGLHHQDSFDLGNPKLEYFRIIGNIYENPDLLPS